VLLSLPSPVPSHPPLPSPPRREGGCGAHQQLGRARGDEGAPAGPVQRGGQGAHPLRAALLHGSAGVPALCHRRADHGLRLRRGQHAHHDAHGRPRAQGAGLGGPLRALHAHRGVAPQAGQGGHALAAERRCVCAGIHPNGTWAGSGCKEGEGAHTLPGPVAAVAAAASLRGAALSTAPWPPLFAGTHALTSVRGTRALTLSTPARPPPHPPIPLPLSPQPLSSLPGPTPAPQTSTSATSPPRARSGATGRATAETRCWARSATRCASRA